MFLCEVHWRFCPIFAFVGTLFFLVLSFCVWVHLFLSYRSVRKDTLVFLFYLSVCGYIRVFVLPFCVRIH